MIAAVPTDLTIRPDLIAAQAEAWRHVTAPGGSWSGVQRAAIAQMALAALDDPDPIAPWESATASGRVVPAAEILPEAVVDAIYRITRHAATLTDRWYEAQLELGLDPFAYVEMVGVVVAVAAVDGFYRASGLERPPLPSPTAGEPHGRHPEVEPATLNWVPVAAPADQTAAVVQGLSAAPAEWDNVVVMSAAQYIPVDEMGELAWTRGTLSRAEIELVAARLSSIRECFF